MDSIGKVSPLKGGWLLLRSIAFISSSVAAIISSMLPLFLYYPISAEKLLPLFCLLLFSAFLIHGVLTHILNDYVDHLSGTDIHSPAILSGGSRVIQKGFITIEKMRTFGIWLVITLVFVLLIFIIFDFYRLTVLLAVGLWGAITYSLPPLRLSYRPFTGEWLCNLSVCSIPWTSRCMVNIRQHSRLGIPKCRHQRPHMYCLGYGASHSRYKCG